jgi:hypothetical protein
MQYDPDQNQIAAGNYNLKSLYFKACGDGQIKVFNAHSGKLLHQM